MMQLLRKIVFNFAASRNARNKHLERIVDHTWDSHSSLCEHLFTFPYRRDIEVPNIMATLGNLKGKAAFDFGSGPGNYARLLKTHGAEKVVGYDISENMIKRAREKEAKQQLGIDYTSNLTPDLNGQFDIVLGVYVIPYALTRPELCNMCAGMARLLRRGGRLVIATVNPDYETTPNYYDAFGIGFTATSTDVNGREIIFEVRKPPQVTQFKLFCWSKGSLEEVWKEVGFCDINWRKLTVYGPCSIDEASEEVRGYMAKPTLAIMECFLQK